MDVKKYINELFPNSKIVEKDNSFTVNPNIKKVIRTTIENGELRFASPTFNVGDNSIKLTDCAEDAIVEKLLLIFHLAEEYAAYNGFVISVKPDEKELHLYAKDIAKGIKGLK